jgi:GntR family transcriptional regulator
VGIYRGAVELLSHTSVRFHIQQESDIPASTQLYNQICFAIAARHFPPGHRLPSTRQLAMQPGLHRNTISKVYRQLENDGVVEAMAGSGIYVRDQQKPREIKVPAGPRTRIRPDIDQEVRRSIDGLLNAGCTLQQARELLTREIDWRLRCGARVLVSTPREDIGASMLIAEELAPNLDVPVEVVPLEELEAVLETSNNGTVVTSRYFLQPVEELAKQHGVRAVAVDLNDFRHELNLLKELRAGSCVGLVSISPGILRAAEVILHSMRGQELLVMTASPDVGSRLLALCRAASHVLCDRPSLPLVEQTLRQNRSQLMRLPQVHCAQSYLGASTIDMLRKEIGLDSPQGEGATA